MPLSAQVLLSIVAHESSSGDLSSQMRVTPANCAVSLSDGTGANRAQVAWSAQRTIGGSEVDDIVFSSMQDDRGSVSFSSVKAWYIKNTSSGEVGDIVIGSDQSDDTIPASAWTGWAVGLVIPAGGAIALVAPSTAGLPVDPANVIRVAGNNGATYDLMLVGEGTVT